MRIKVHDRDKAKTDACCISDVVLSKTEDRNYKLVTKGCILKQLHSITVFRLCKNG